MKLPFTPEQFFAAFADYNQSFWLVAVGFWIASAVAVAAAWRNPTRHGRALIYLLTALWMWNAIAYHALFFTRINPAAWLFAALFTLQAALLWLVAVRMQGEPISRSGTLGTLAVALVLYSFAYPFLSLALGHQYPAVPTFAVPCPTAILTIGVLLTMRHGLPAWAGAVPAIWAVIGGSAAILLDIWTDYGLLIAGALLAVSWIGRGKTSSRSVRLQAPQHAAH